MTQSSLLLGESTADLSTDELINLIMLRVRSRQEAVTASCSHPISDALMPKLPKPKTCPVCFIKQHIETIKDVQRRLVDRGGVFTSKEEQGHKALRKELRDAKIGLANAIAQFELMVVEAQLPSADLTHIENALGEWENKKIQLAKIPGLVYVSGAEEEEPTEEDHEVARLMIELLKTALKRELTPEDMKEVTTTTTTSTPVDTGDQLPDQISPLPHQHLPPQQRDTAIPDISGLCSTPIDEKSQDKATPRSILKRKGAFSPANSPTTSHIRKRVRTRNFAAVSPEALNTSNPFPFAQLSDHWTVQSHRPQTFAEQHRPRSDFHRGSPSYIPGFWASSAFNEKANTSLFKIPWDEAEEQMRREQEEAAEEKKLVERLKMVSQAWMGIWWTKEVLQHVDLEKIREAGLAAGSGTNPETDSIT